MTTKGQLICLAAEIIRGAKMPSVFYKDWDFRKTTPHADKTKVLDSARMAREQCREWAIRIREIADGMTP